MGLFSRSDSGPRRPAVAGKFYPSGKKDCIELIEDCFRHEFGPGTIPQVPDERIGTVMGAVVPHAGWIYSGPIAAHSFSRIAEDGFPETFVIIGPNHTGMGNPVAVATRDYSTPLGTVETDRELLRAMRGTIIVEDDDAHAMEHSIEVQVPFLQYFGKPFKMVAVCMGAQRGRIPLKVGAAVADAIRETGRDAVIIASSDFTHAGMFYSDPVPEGMQPGEYAKKRDRAALEAIEHYDPRRLIDVVEGRGITMCGYGPVAAMLEATKLLGGRKVEVLKYSTSQHVRGEKYSDIAVGYGAAVVTR